MRTSRPEELMTSKNIAESEQMLATECRHQAMQSQLLVSAVVGTLEIPDASLQAQLMARSLGPHAGWGARNSKKSIFYCSETFLEVLR